MNQNNRMGSAPFKSARVAVLPPESRLDRAAALPPQDRRPDRAAMPPADPDDEIDIDIRDIANKIWRGKWIIFVTTLMSSVVAFLLISQMEPRYKASAKMLFDVQNRNVVNVDQIIVNSDVSEYTLQNQVEILSSTKLIERVVVSLGLDRNPEFNPALRPVEETVLGQLRDKIVLPPEVTDLLQNIGVVAPPPPPPDADQIAEMEQLEAERQRLSTIGIVAAGLDLRPISGSKVIEISITSGNPMTSAAIANTIAEQYIVGQLDAKLDATRQATEWLSTRVEDLRTQVKEAEDAVERTRAEQSIAAGQSLEITRQQLQAMSSSLSLARSQTTLTRATFDRLRSAFEDGRDYGAIDEFRNSALIQSYREQEAQALAQLKLLETSVGADHPARVRLASQIGELQDNIDDEARRVVAAAEASWKAAQAQESMIEGKVRELETKTQEQSREEVEIRQLEREAQASRLLYENFLSRLEETSQQDELQTADARILSPAEPPLSAQSQSKRRLLTLALLLGAMAGVGIVFLLDKLNNTFRSPQQVEALTGETVLGTIPAVGRRLHRQDVVQHFKTNPKSSLAESIRSLRTSFLFSNVDNPPKVVMFTSSVPREGKSTTSMLAALTSRQMGKSAIIVDCDLRLPSLARLLNADDGKPGLLSVLDGSAHLDDAIFRDPETGLRVLMTKASEPRSNLNAADILSSRKFNEILKQLSSEYDLVILDTPPVLVVADARILATHADTVVYVVRWDHTPRGAVLEGLKELRSINAPIAGIALTQVNEARAGKYSYDGYSYYKGRYKDYYLS